MGWSKIILVWYRTVTTKSSPKIDDFSPTIKRKTWPKLWISHENTKISFINVFMLIGYCYSLFPCSFSLFCCQNDFYEIMVIINHFNTFPLGKIKSWHLCSRKEDPFQGLKLGSCLTHGNELSEETHVLTKQEILLGKGAWWRTVGSGNQELSHGLQSRFYGDRISFPLVVFSQSF